MRPYFTALICLLSIHIQAQTPTEQVSIFSVNEIYAWKANLQIKVPTSSDSAILIISRSPLTSLTLTNKFYGLGFNISAGVKVIRKFYKGSNTINFTLSSLEANTTYYIVAYTFNNNGSGIFYNLTNPARLEFTTKGRTIGNYYQSLDTNKAVFLTQLGVLLRNHEFNSNWYSDFSNLISEVYERDTFAGNQSLKYIVCDYSNKIATYSGAFSFSLTNTNREHTMPKNWINFRGVPNSNLVDYPEGADWHNLTLTNENVNAQRADFVFKIPKTPSNTGTARYYENKSNYNDTNNCFEPQNSYKGNAARCIFYMQVCYNGQLSKNWGFKKDLLSFGKIQNQNLLKSWTKLDPVDNFEIARNECIAFHQKSRNPFIDFPDWVDCINFEDISQLKSCEGLTIGANFISQINTPWDIWYYPYSSENYVLKYYLQNIAPIDIHLFDLNGRLISHQKSVGNSGENSSWIDVSMLPKGNYIIHILSRNLSKSTMLTKD